MSDPASASDADRDPFAVPTASPRGATPLAVIGFVLAVASLITGLAPLAGPAGMACGLIAHVKGSRLGMPAAVAAAVGMIAGFAVTMYLR
ncbi:MAG: hypothetical protein JJT89_04650 [Nitriliruptoraceae bacterium]|nr:hypothetical protein [Nitriliruptoraceae bacterium]